MKRKKSFFLPVMHIFKNIRNLPFYAHFSVRKVKTSSSVAKKYFFEPYNMKGISIKETVKNNKIFINSVACEFVYRF